LLKRKPVYDQEFEVVGFTSGKKGKALGAVIWQCKTLNEKIFNVDPTGEWASYKNRYNTYKECIKNNGQGFIDKYKGRKLLVEFREWTNKGIPSHAKAISFRDYI